MPHLPSLCEIEIGLSKSFYLTPHADLLFGIFRKEDILPSQSPVVLCGKVVDRGSSGKVPEKKVGERGRNRTYNLLIKSQLLCQLSYAPAGGNIAGKTNKNYNIRSLWQPPHGHANGDHPPVRKRTISAELRN